MGKKFKIFLKTDYESLTRALDRWNFEESLGLAWHGDNGHSTIWGIGNSLLIATRVDRNTTELQLRPPELSWPISTARFVWNKIGELFVKAGWLAHHEAITLDQLETLHNELEKIEATANIQIPEQPWDDRQKHFDEERKTATTRLSEHSEAIALSTQERAAQWLTDQSFANEADHIKLRRRKVKQLFSQGMFYEEIAAEVFASPSTVKRDLKVLGLKRRKKGSTP